jgi:DtxR family Mn-dependent transcriptional regulator
MIRLSGKVDLIIKWCFVMEYLNSSANPMSESIEMYLLSIALLQHEGQPVPVPTLAHELSVSLVSANEMSRKLVDKQLIEYEPYKGVRLTPLGEQLARHVLRCRRLWEVFFVEKLGIEPHIAEELACRFEHVTPEPLAEQLATFLEYPSVSPQNQPIPYEHGPLVERLVQPLTTLIAGECGQVVSLTVDDVTQDFLRHQGLLPGSIVEVLAVTAEGARLLEIANQRLSLSSVVADKIGVTLEHLAV